MTCTEAYKEHIEYTFNSFCRIVIRYVAINAWRDRDKRLYEDSVTGCISDERFTTFGRL